MQRRVKVLFVLTACGVLAGLCLAIAEPLATKLFATSNMAVIEQEASYKAVTYEEMIAKADLVFVGTVKDVSPTTWNQDSGEAWFPKDDSAEVALQLHTITLAVSQVLADRGGFANDLIEITVLGRSPQEAKSEYKLDPGTEVLVFVQQVEIAWRDGKKKVFSLMSAPSASYFTKGADGLYHGEILQDGEGIKGPVSPDEVADDIAHVN